jgi:hypothetical protein
MDIEISIAGPDSLDDLMSLEDWLLNEPRLMGCPVSRPPAVPERGQMGALSEVLVVALGSGGSGAALAGALSVWLRTRVSTLTLRIRTPQGEVEFTAHSTEDATKIIDAISPLVADGGSEPS